MRPTRILFIGYYGYNFGSSNALLGYYRAAQRLKIDLRVSAFSRVDDTIAQTFPIAAEDWQPDVAVLIYESFRFLTTRQLSTIVCSIPRRRRILIDPDGKFFPTTVAGTDTNHSEPASEASWRDLYTDLSDVILQPTLGIPAPGAERLLYFGIDSGNIHASEIEKPFDLLYVGNNWYRWHDMASLIKSIASIRAQLGRIALFGNYWDGIFKN